MMRIVSLLIFLIVAAPAWSAPALSVSLVPAAQNPASPQTGGRIKPDSARRPGRTTIAVAAACLAHHSPTAA